MRDWALGIGGALLIGGTLAGVMWATGLGFVLVVGSGVWPSGGGRGGWNAREREIIRHLPNGRYPVAMEMDEGYAIRGYPGRWTPVEGMAVETEYGGLVQLFEDRDINGRLHGRLWAEHHPFDGQTPNVRPGSRLHWLLFRSPEGDYFQQYQTRRDAMQDEDEDG